ncbi:hypothetical protein [Streptomyces sp. NBC_00572]|uniref:hypothetical protein n=1 Tax=Streptomyces sp. NBC_00572 TaxID=2903664 RepID=UPI00225BE7FA|nr:hypothetical protein [Streptomyces sp. NBC_00572]MCX4982233.1 hypothetical protein [Streptomyces sp. NBC_00572]
MSIRIPSGTRQESTHTVYVSVRAVPAAIGAGSGWVEMSVAQSTPRAPMTWVAKVTVPERAAVPPLFEKVTVTFSHQRRSPSARTGAETVTTAGPGVGLGVGTGVGVVGAGVPVPVPGAGSEGGAEGVRGGVPAPGPGGVPPEPPGAVVGAALDPVPVPAPAPAPVLASAPEDPGVPGGAVSPPTGGTTGDGSGSGEGDDVLDVSPRVVGPSRGTSVTAPEGVPAPPGEGPAPTAAYPSPSPPPPQAVSAPPRQSATATSPGFLRLMTASLADDPSVREPFGELSPR